MYLTDFGRSFQVASILLSGDGLNYNSILLYLNAIMQVYE